MENQTNTLTEEQQIELLSKKKEEDKKKEEKPEMKGDDINFRKRGAVLIDIFGKQEKRKRAISLGLSDLILPPITRKSIATYRVVSQNVINPATRQEADPKTVILPGTYKLYDWGEGDFTKRWKIMKNLSGAGDIVEDKVTGKQVIEDVIEPVVLMNGIKKIDVERNYREYVFMELHPLNGSYKRRDNSFAKKFIRTDLETNKSVAFKSAEMDLAYQAEGEILKMNKDEIIGYATTANIPTYEGTRQRMIAEVKSDLRVFARSDPRRFYSMANNVEAAVRMNVLDVLGFGLMEYQPDKRRYVVPYTDEVIHTHAVQEDPTESLVKMLSKKENNELYGAVVELMDYWQIKSA